MTSRDEMREFEKNAVIYFGKVLDFTHAETVPDAYESSLTQMAYMGWQASRASMGDVVRRSEVEEAIRLIEYAKNGCDDCYVWDGGDDEKGVPDQIQTIEALTEALTKLKQEGN